MMTDMHKRTVVSVFAGAVLGWFLTAFVFYPPHAHWDDDLKFGDLATWMAAFGTVAAVLWAIHLARSESKYREQDAYAKGLVMASYLFTEVGLLDTACVAVMKQLENAKRYSDQRATTILFEARAQFERTELNKIEASLERLAWLPPRHAIGLASLPDMKRVIRIVMDPNAPTPTAQQAHAACDRGIVQLTHFKRVLTDFIDEFLPQFAT